MSNKVEYGFQKLEVWKLSMELVSDIYGLTRKFPKEETYGLTSQMRRAAVSVSLNIAEGSIRRTKKDFASFIRISLGSLMELLTCLEIAKNQKYLEHDSKLASSIEKLYFKLISLDKFLSNKN